MSFAIQFTDKALAHIEKLKKSGNIGVTKKIRRLLDELKEPLYPTSYPLLSHKLKNYIRARAAGLFKMD